jgi:phosphate transport system substrate-binding protein
MLGGAMLALGAAASATAADVTALPEYRPAQTVSGTIRNCGAGFGGLLQRWEAGFARFHPDIRFEDRLPGSDGASACLITGVADLGTSGREPMLTEYEAFYDAFNSEMVEIPVATGTLDAKGSTWTVAVFVNKDNPVTHLSMRQLDGIFGAERTGGYHGFIWSPQAGRAAREDIRTWGQLGLEGPWANKPIQTYGYAPTGMANFFELKVFNGGSKWNPNYREYVESGSKLVAPGGEALGIQHMLGELAANKYGIAWTGLNQARDFPGIRVLELSAQDSGPFVAPTRDSVQERTYPLARSVYMLLRRETALEPRFREFLTYILSRQGQEEVLRQNLYMPLTADVARDQRKKLDSGAPVAKGAGPAELEIPQPAAAQQWNVITYGQALVSQIAASHSEIMRVDLYAKPPDASSYIVAASTRQFRVGGLLGPEHEELVTGPQSVVRRADGTTEVLLPLNDASARRVGSLAMQFAPTAKETDAVAKTAVQVRDEMGKMIGSASQLFAVAAPDRPNDIYAQALVEMTSARHPELNSLGLHVSRTAGAENVIIAASSRIKLGKKSDPDDLVIMEPGAAPNVVAMEPKQITDTGLPLYDAKGRVIGTVVAEIKYGFVRTPEGALKRAIEIRDELKRQIQSKEQLFLHARPVASGGTL